MQRIILVSLTVLENYEFVDQWFKTMIHLEETGLLWSRHDADAYYIVLQKSLPSRQVVDRYIHRPC